MPLGRAKAVGARFMRAARAFATQLQPGNARPVPSRSDLVRELGLVRRIDRHPSYLGAGLTPGRLDSILKAADQGMIGQWMELLEDIELDPQIGACNQARKLAVVGEEWELLPGGETDLDKAASEACDKMLRRLPAFEESCIDLLDGTWKGFSPEEIVWGYGTDAIFQPEQLIWKNQRGFWVNSTREEWPLDQLRRLTDEQPTYGVELETDKWLVHRPRLRSGPLSKAGTGRMVAWLKLVKAYAVRDWAAFAEVFATPLRIGKYEPGTPQEEIDALRSGLLSLGSDGVAVINKLTEISLQGVQGQSGDKVYLELCRYLDAQITKAILGHVAATDAVAGSLGGAETTALQVRQDIKAADAVALSTTLRRDLLAPYCWHRWEGHAATPYHHWLVEPPEDLKAKADVYQILSGITGLQLVDEQLREEFGLWTPKPGQKLVGGGTAGALGGPPSPFGAPQPLQTMQAMASRALMHDVQRSEAPRSVQLFEEHVQRLLKASLSEADVIWRRYLAPVMQAIETAKSWEELQAVLGGLQLSPDELADILDRTKLAAQMAGRWEGTKDVGLNLGELPRTLAPLSPDDAASWLGRRVDMTREELEQASAAVRRKAFTIAGEQSVEVIGQVRSSIETALSEGQTFRTWQRQADVEGLGLGQAHQEVIFQNAINSSLAAGRWKAQTSPSVVALRPYLQYRTAGDRAVRHDHSEMDGLVYPAGHAFWRTYYPPNGHRCRCSAISLSERQVQARGYTVQSELPPVVPDKGWAINPGVEE